MGNTSIIERNFESFEAAPASFDLIVFVASLHHMDQKACLDKAKKLLAPSGKLLIIGCTTPNNLSEWAMDILRILPARLGSIVHGEQNGGMTGAPTERPRESFSDVQELITQQLPGARIRRGLYYRYLLSWEKPK